MRRTVLAVLAAVLIPAETGNADALSGAQADLRTVQCKLDELSLPKGSRCAVLSVPEDYTTPAGRGRRLEIPLLQLGPLNPDHMAVVLGGGGPGASVGMGSYGELAFWERFRSVVLGADRGLLLVEQRGVVEEPPLRCKEIRIEVGWVIASNLSIEEEYGVLDSAASACFDRLTGMGIGLQHYTTGASAEDFERLRRALGVERLDLIAVSYSSMIAFELARRHPASVRAMILDSPLIPTREPEHDSVYLDRMFKRLSDKCLSLRSCWTSYGNMSRNLRAAARRMDHAPIRVPVPDTNELRGLNLLLNGHRLISSVELAFYRRDLVDELPQYLYELAVLGNSPRSPEYVSNLVRFYRMENLAEALHYSIVCREQMPFLPSDAPATDIEWSNERNAVYGKQFCADIWNLGHPIKPADIPDDGHPMLFLTGTLDWVTPEEVTIAAIADLADAQHASLNSTHGTLFNNSCALKVAKAFMTNPEANVFHPCLERQAANFP